MPEAGVRVGSWGSAPLSHAASIPLHWRHLPLPAAEGSLLPRAFGRSYGDSCLNEGGTLLDTRGLDRLIAFDGEKGSLACEAGVRLGDILELILPAGWILPVVPGTANVSVGGAIANDVHGKNHHVAGTFGHHVERFELLRSDGSRRTCSATENADMFRATIGGLGLTGLITWAQLRLQRAASASFEVQTRATANLDDFFAASAESDGRFEYTVAWVDALAGGEHVGRGVFMRANLAPGGDAAPPAGTSARLAIPFDLPAGVLSRHAIRAFNRLYRSRASREWKPSREPYAKFLFPLDAIANWNRMYGGRGFFQHQSVVPSAHAPGAIREMLVAAAAAEDASFLSVLKVFGDRESAGLLSFARPGVTLALDIPMRGPATLALLDRLDAIVRAAGGAIYPAKDAHMSSETFKRSFPRWEELANHADPAFSSSFWRRVSA